MEDLNFASKTHMTFLLTSTIRMRKVRSRENIQKVLSLYNTQSKWKCLKRTEKKHTGRLGSIFMPGLPGPRPREQRRGNKRLPLHLLLAMPASPGSEAPLAPEANAPIFRACPLFTSCPGERALHVQCPRLKGRALRGGACL